ncbi:MAG: hypothetical protein HZA51_17150 [Planctomycetes bacterium]|nr:hypothetical protein [Planctomycetota bacterium]
MSQPPIPTSTCPTPQRRRPRIRVVALFFLISTFFILGAIEIALRLFHPAPFPEFLQYEIDGHIRVRPIAGQVVTNRANYPVRINRHGFRGPDYSYTKPPGTLRILVFGGSAAFDFEASSEEKSWPGALQLKLSQQLIMPVEVINLAVPGFDSFNCKINYLYTGRNFHPDAAILYETWNDMGQYRDVALAPYRKGESQLNKPLWQRIARYSQIVRHIHPFIRSLQGKRLDDIAKSTANAGSDLEKPVASASLDWGRTNFTDFIDFVTRDGALPIVSTMAFLGSTDSLKVDKIRQAVAEGCIQRGFSPDRAVETFMAMSAIIRDVAAARNAVFIDGYNAVPHDLDHIRDNVHLYDAGSEKLAEAMARTLLADSKFQQLVERVRKEATAFGKG